MAPKKQHKIVNSKSLQECAHLLDVLRILPDEVLSGADRQNLQCVSRAARALVAGLHSTLRLLSGVSATDMSRLLSALQERPGVRRIILTLPDLQNTSLLVATLMALRDKALTNNLQCVEVSGYQPDSASKTVPLLLGMLTCAFPRMEELVLGLPILSTSAPVLGSWQHHQHLKQLTLRNEVDETAMQYLSNVSSLRRLQIDTARIRNSSMAEALTQLTRLDSLAVKWAVPIKHMSALSTLTALTQLRWSRRESGVRRRPAPSADNAALASLSTLVNLQELHLEYLYLQDEGMQGISAMTQLTRLTVDKLQLRDCPPAGARGLKELELAWLAPPAQLLQLLGTASHRVTRNCGWLVGSEVNGCPKTEAGVQRIADSLRQLMTQYANDTRVTLVGNGVDAVPVRPLLCALQPAAAHLRECCLCYLSLQRHDLEGLAGACPRLVKLELGQCRLESGGLVALMPLTQLSELSLKKVDFVPLSRLHAGHVDNADDGAAAAQLANACNKVSNLAVFGMAWSQAHSSASQSSSGDGGCGQPLVIRASPTTTLEAPAYSDLQELLRTCAPLITLAELLWW